MSKPTPGPWIFVSGNRIHDVVGNDGQVIMTFHRLDGDIAIKCANAAHIVKCVNMHDETTNLLNDLLENFRPKECSCDGEYEDGRLVGHACYFHRNEDAIRRLLAKAEAEE